MKNLAAISLTMLLSACVTSGPPVENQRERRVEKSLEEGVKRDGDYHHRHYHDGHYHYHNYDHDDHNYDDDYVHHNNDDSYDDDSDDPMGNYDQHDDSVRRRN